MLYYSKNLDEILNIFRDIKKTKKDTNQISRGENHNCEMKISLEETDDRLGIAEEKISKSEDSNRKYANETKGE